MESAFATVLSWWRARTGREQLLLQGAGIFIFAVLAPVWIYLSASSFRAEAASRLETARHVEAQVAQLAAQAGREAGPAAGGDSSLNGRALAAAQAAGLQPRHIESSAGQSIRISFEPADSLAVYRWIAAVGASGAYVTRTAIVRVADSEQVTAEFDVAESP